jgi:hypothetical protein
MNKNIIFIKNFDIAKEYFPQPSSIVLPEWYKKTQSYLNNKKEIVLGQQTTATIKRCIPVFDALTAGYTISTHVDVFVRKNDLGDIFYTQSGGEINIIETHSIIQAPYHPFMNHQPYPKWINPWGIKTPKGYSCLFISPVHGGNEYFQIIEGIVDTDTFNLPVNFPFVLKDINFEGIIPAGTPIVQIIPFKRDIWKMKQGNEKDIESLKNIKLYITSKFMDRYRNMFWQRKQYK